MDISRKGDCFKNWKFKIRTHFKNKRGTGRDHDFFRAGEVWAKKGTMLLIHTNKIVICSCKDLLFWPFKLLKYAEIDTKCIYFQLRTDAKI